MLIIKITCSLETMEKTQVIIQISFISSVEVVEIKWMKIPSLFFLSLSFPSLFPFLPPSLPLSLPPTFPSFFLLSLLPSVLFSFLPSFLPFPSFLSDCYGRKRKAKYIYIILFFLFSKVYLIWAKYFFSISSSGRKLYIFVIDWSVATWNVFCLFFYLYFSCLRNKIWKPNSFP